jgi:hypothetical protein
MNQTSTEVRTGIYARRQRRTLHLCDNVVKADRYSRICDTRLRPGLLTESWAGGDQAMVGGAN